MSENIPESIPTHRDPRSGQATKKRALSPRSKQSAHVEHLFANPDKAMTSMSKTTTSSSSTLPPEIVANVQGSSAGAGSGEFHVYKASRRREYERLRAMDEEKEDEEKDTEFQVRKKEQVAKDLEKTDKNRLKREKARLRKEKGKMGKKEEGTEGEAKEKKEKFKANVAVKRDGLGGEVEAGTKVEEQGIVFLDED